MAGAALTLALADAPGVAWAQTSPAAASCRDSVTRWLDRRFRTSWSFDRTKNIHGERVDFNDPAAPHYLMVHPFGAAAAFPSHCALFVYAHDKKTGARVAPLLENNNGSLTPQYKIGASYQAVAEGAVYTIEVHACDVTLGGMSSERAAKLTMAVDYSAAAACAEKRNATPSDPISSNAEILARPIGPPAKVLVRSDRRAAEPGAPPKAYSYGVSKTDVISFGAGFQIGGESGVDLGALKAAISAALERSTQIQYEQERSFQVTVGIDGDVCRNWLVQFTETRQNMLIEAPGYGLDRAAQLTVVLDIEGEAIKLCQ